MNNNKVYYGEFSLKHWAELMITQDIVLPDYQRDFKWDEKSANEFLESLNDGIFVPPVTIGSFKKNDKVVNYILDGQQRLSSILLAQLGYFINHKKVAQGVAYLNENDNQDDKEDAGGEDNIIFEWQFGRIFENIDDYSLPALREKLSKDKELYNKWSNPIFTEDFFKNTYLGYSYIVPSEDDKTANICFARTFRNINHQGEPLQPIESRKALYYLDKSLTELFDPLICREINPNAQIDFVRYLSLISQYRVLEGVRGMKGQIARGYANDMEKYYETYINAVVEQKNNTIFGENVINFYDKFSNLIIKLQDDKYKLMLQHEYKSIIDADIYFFGLVYCVIFMNKEIDADSIDRLRKSLDLKIKDLKSSSTHKAKPALLKHVNERLTTSIKIYQKYCIA